jgi:hypothetical protein
MKELMNDARLCAPKLSLTNEALAEKVAEVQGK